MREQMHVRIVPMTGDHLDEVAELERICFTTPWSRNMLVEELQKNGRLKNLKGLLYFTDGDGIYPTERPEYETAFVFLNEALKKGKPPAWAHSLTLDLCEETTT